MVRVSVIGTAGRAKDKRPFMTRKLYGAMLQTAWDFLDENFQDHSEIVLQSGGAAWADHLAVSLYRLGRIKSQQFAGLELHLPCPFVNSQFVGTDRASERTAQTSNYYHRLFTRVVGTDSLRSLQRALDEDDVHFTVGRGFFDRNTRVAQCDIMLAFTWGGGNVPLDGGTKNTIIYDQTVYCLSNHGYRCILF